MNRRGFLKRLGIGSAAAVVAPEAIAAVASAPTMPIKAVETVTSVSVGAPSVMSVWTHLSSESTVGWRQFFASESGPVPIQAFGSTLHSTTSTGFRVVASEFDAKEARLNAMWDRMEERSS